MNEYLKNNCGGKIELHDLEAHQALVFWSHILPFGIWELKAKCSPVQLPDVGLPGIVLLNLD